MQVRRRTTRRRGAAAAALVAAGALVATGCASGTTKASSSPSPSASATSAAPSTVTVAVYGAAPVLATYRSLAAAYTKDHPEVQVKVLGYRSHDAAMTALQEARDAGDPPDLFLADHGDLAQLEQQDALRRVDDLLSERQVDFGDGFARNGLEAFSSDAALQCMPVDVSPLVVFYNPQLVELDQLREPGRRQVSQDTGWNLDDFAAAAAQPQGGGVRGVYVAPEIEQVAPFIWSGGGKVVDDTDKPTTTTLGDDSSAEAIDRLLTIVRDPALTFTPQQLRRSSALQRFERGKLGMMLGYRDMVPELREHQSLTFDVMPVPRLGSTETIGRMTGMCLSSTVEDPEDAADVLAALISKRAASALAATGYAMPTNLSVLNSDAFLQTGTRPLHSTVFPRELRNIQLLPDATTWPAVETQVDRQLRQLFTRPPVLTLQDTLEALDDDSQPIFDPSKADTASPSATPSSDASPSPSDSGSASPSQTSTP